MRLLVLLILRTHPKVWNAKFLSNLFSDSAPKMALPLLLLKVFSIHSLLLLTTPPRGISYIIMLCPYSFFSAALGQVRMVCLVNFKPRKIRSLQNIQLGLAVK